MNKYVVGDCDYYSKLAKWLDILGLTKLLLIFKNYTIEYFANTKIKLTSMRFTFVTEWIFIKSYKVRNACTCFYKMNISIKFP